jgi:threonine dehydratase
MTIDAADLGVSCGASQLLLKLEQTQHSGSFKARGALHALLTAEQAPDGVVAASGGNHGVAVAWAARSLGLAANIFVPDIAAAAKVDRLRRLDAVVHQVGVEYSESLAAAHRFTQDKSVTTVHAYDQFEVIAGSGTLARELDEQTGHAFDTVVVACGGGGLAGGLSSWWGSAKRLLLVETTGTATYSAALAHGGPVDVSVAGVAADALGARRLGDLPWAALSRTSAESVLVGDEAVAAAQQVLWDEVRLRVEPAAATALAALRVGAVECSPDERVAVVLCGANVS